MSRNEQSLPVSYLLTIRSSYVITDKVQGFMGFVECRVDGVLVWTEKTGIYRYTKEDARADAKKLESEIDTRMSRSWVYGASREV